MSAPARLEGTSGTGEPVLVAAKLTKSYRDLRVLDGVDLVVDRSSFLVLLGPSGSGKTTLLRCIAGTERLSAGTLTIDGRAVAGPRKHLSPERRNLSMVFQDYALWPHMTAAENVGFALRRLSLGSEERRRRALEMLERVGIAQLGDQYPGRLSGGQQQRVALARALVAQSPLLLCDEPLSNLDAHLREQVRVEIATLARDSEATVVYITHDQVEAFSLADQLAVINQGRILQIGPPEEVYRMPASTFVAHFTGLAGTLAGEVVGGGGPGLIRVRSGPAELRATAMRGVRGGERVQLLLRPDSVSLGEVRPEAEGLTGTIRDSSFRAGAYDHVVDVEGGSRLTGVRSHSRAARGGRVAIAIDPQGCLAFPERDARSAHDELSTLAHEAVDRQATRPAEGADLRQAPA